MIYSKRLQNYIPVQVESSTYSIPYYGNFTKYIVKDNKVTIGYVDVKDVQGGINVEFIKNQQPDLYKGFGTVADQIEVEHCLKRGLTDFNIDSIAALNSHALHYLRGKRFYSKEVEEQVKFIIENTSKGKKFDTRFLGAVDMYMPKNLIQKYIDIIKKMPLILK